MLFVLYFAVVILLQVWLIEINVNPALHTNCEVLRNMLPAMVEETLGREV